MFTPASWPWTWCAPTTSTSAQSRTRLFREGRSNSTEDRGRSRETRSPARCQRPTRRLLLRSTRRHDVDPRGQSSYPIQPGRARVSPGRPGGLGLRQRQLESNTFEAESAGALGNEVTYTSTTDLFYGINNPEVMLAESSYGVLFEGRPGAISADGRLLVLPDLRAWAAAGSTGPGLVVSILRGVGPGGAPDSSLAGEWFRVAQQVSLMFKTILLIELLMDDPLPAMPQGGYYVVEVTGGFVNNSFIDNQINLAGKNSTALDSTAGARLQHAGHGKSRSVGGASKLCLQPGHRRP